MTHLWGLLFLIVSACSGANPAVLELAIRKDGGVTANDVARLERRVLAIRGVTLVSVSAARNTLIVHHGAETEVAQIEAVLRGSGLQWAGRTD